MSEIVTSTLGSAAQPGSLLRDPTLSARSPSQVILRVRCRYATPSRAGAHQGSGGAEAEDLADGGPAGRWGRVG